MLTAVVKDRCLPERRYVADVAYFVLLRGLWQLGQDYRGVEQCGVKDLGDLRAGNEAERSSDGFVNFLKVALVLCRDYYLLDAGAMRSESLFSRLPAELCHAGYLAGHGYVVPYRAAGEPLTSAVTMVMADGPSWEPRPGGVDVQVLVRRIGVDAVCPRCCAHSSPQSAPTPSSPRRVSR